MKDPGGLAPIYDPWLGDEVLPYKHKVVKGKRKTRGKKAKSKWH